MLRHKKEDDENLDIMEQPDDPREKVIGVCLFIVLIVVALFALWKIIGIFSEYHAGESTYEDFQEYVFLPEETEESLPAASQEADAADESLTETEQTVHYGSAPTVDFTGLQAENGDVKAWIYAPDTRINYPVVQGTDDEYYLTHMINGNTNSCGAIFMEAENAADFSDRNTIIYGHHMKNGTMFAGLMNYSAQEYYDTHPVMYIVQPDQTYVLRIFAAFVTQDTGDVWQWGFESEESFGKWLNQMCSRSYFTAEITPTSADHVVTLSTCSYEYDEARFVVMGVLEAQ